MRRQAKLTSTRGEAGARFEWSGGHPALDFVNTLDERLSAKPGERLVDYASLLDFVVASGVLDRLIAARLRRGCKRRRAGAVLRRIRGLRESVHRVLAAMAAGRAPPARDLANLSTAIAAAQAARRLVTDPAAGTFRWSWRDQAAIELPLYACMLAVASLVGDAAAIRKCAADDCGVWFVDRSRNRRRIWCSMKSCGNRAKQRRFRAM